MRNLKKLLLLIILLSAMSSALAQTATSLTGTVSDEQGGKVRGAVVRLFPRSGLPFNTTTDENGVFQVNRVRAGNYTVEIHATGFATYVSELIQIRAGQTANEKFVLKLASVTASVTVVATGTPQRAEEVAKVVSVLSAKDIDSQHAVSLTESLRTIPGVRVQQQGSAGALATVRLRGQRTYDTALLFDGLRVRDAGDINGSAVSLFTDVVPLMVESVEVLRGSGSSIYGTNAIGGVINLIPNTGVGPLQMEAGFEGGTLSSFSERLKAAGSVEKLGYSLGFERIDVRNGIDGDDEYGDSVGTGRFQLSPREDMAVTINLFGTIGNARVNDSPFALSPAFSSNESFPTAREGVNFHADFNNPDQGRRNRLLVGSVRFTQEVNRNLSYSIAYQRVSSKRRNYNGSQVDPQFAELYPFGDFEFVNTNNGLTDTLDARANMSLSNSNVTTIGVEFERESLFQQSIPSFSSFNNTTDRQRTFAIFGQDQLALFDRRLQFSFALRGQFFRLRAADRPGFLSTVTAERSLTGDGALSYFFRSTGTKLRAHVGNGFRAPSLFERFGAGTFQDAGFTRFGDPTLRAEQSISVDGGIDQRFWQDRFILGATYFYTRLQRVISFRSFAVDPLNLGRFSGYINEPGGLARGAELFIEANPIRGAEVRSAYTYTNSDRLTIDRGLQPEYVIPAHSFNFSWNQRYRKLMVHVDLNRTGSYIAPVFENNFPFRMAELKFAGYTKLNVYGSYTRTLSDRVAGEFFAGAENLLDEEYFENGFRAPGIVGRAGVTIRF